MATAMRVEAVMKLAVGCDATGQTMYIYSSPTEQKRKAVHGVLLFVDNTDVDGARSEMFATIASRAVNVCMSCIRQGDFEGRFGTFGGYIEASFDGSLWWV